jgi:hypothetical protein
VLEVTGSSSVRGITRRRVRSITEWDARIPEEDGVAASRCGRVGSPLRAMPVASGRATEVGMRKSAAIGIGALSLLLLVGCETKGVSVEIPGFDDAAVEGIWLWRLSETSGDYERICLIELIPGDDASSVDYIQRCDLSGDGMLLEARLQALTGDPTGARLDLWYVRWEEPGAYRASLVNEWGESELSPTPIPL